MAIGNWNSSDSFLQSWRNRFQDDSLDAGLTPMIIDLDRMHVKIKQSFTHEMRNLNELNPPSEEIPFVWVQMRCSDFRCAVFGTVQPFKGAEATRNAIKEQAISIPGQGTLRAEKYLLAATGQPPGMFFFVEMLT